MAKTIAVYERVSSKGQNLDGQHADLAAWVRPHGLTQPVRWHTDKFTGKTMNRPGFNALMDDVRAGKVHTLVVWRLDRLGRSASGLTALIEELQRLGVNFVSLREGIDLSTPAGRLIANVLASCAAYETEVRAERQAVGIAAAKAKGKRWGGSEKGRQLKRSAEVDRNVRSLREQGESVAAIARLTKLSRPTVYAILES